MRKYLLQGSLGPKHLLSSPLTSAKRRADCGGGRGSCAREGRQMAADVWITTRARCVLIIWDMPEGTTGDRTIRHQRTKKWVTDADEIVAPKGYRVVEVNTESSAELRDLASYRRDLERARSYMTVFSELVAESNSAERTTNDAFMVAALTLYGRAFGNGVRRARVGLGDLDSTQHEAHSFFIDLRNKYVAHAVNSYEQTTVIAYLTNSAFTPPQITRVGQRHIDLVPIDEEDAAQFIELCEFYIERLQTRIENLHRTVTDELWNSGRDAVYALPALSTPAGLERADVRRGRKP
jgi:hypothetical protein